MFWSGIVYRDHTLTHFKHSGLPQPNSVNAYSTVPKALDIIASSK